MEYRAHYQSPIGNIFLLCNDSSLLKLEFCSSEVSYFSKHIILDQAKCYLDEYFSFKQPSIMPPIQIEGSNFKKLVTQIMLEIPYGKVTTYKEVTKEVEKRTGKKSCAQAVGSAISHNNLAIIVPCHRVIGSDGSLTGYAWGIDKKLKLLENEIKAKQKMDKHCEQDLAFSLKLLEHYHHFH